MKNWTKLASSESIEKTIGALKLNGIESIVVKNGEDAKRKVLELLPKGAEVMDMSSATLLSIGLKKEIQESGNYESVKVKLATMDREKQQPEMRKMGSAPEWSVGSVQAVSEDGHVLIASNTGSQLPAYAYGASHVIWVVGTQKIVKNIEEGMKRIYEHSLPLERERAQKAYGQVANTQVSKVLIVNRENTPGRITLIFVKENLGF